MTTNRVTALLTVFVFVLAAANFQQTVGKGAWVPCPGCNAKVVTKEPKPGPGVKVLVGAPTETGGQCACLWDDDGEIVLLPCDVYGTECLAKVKATIFGSAGTIVCRIDDNAKAQPWKKPTPAMNCTKAGATQSATATNKVCGKVRQVDLWIVVVGAPLGWWKLVELTVSCDLCSEYCPHSPGAVW